MDSQFLANQQNIIFNNFEWIPARVLNVVTDRNRAQIRDKMFLTRLYENDKTYRTTSKYYFPTS